MKDKICLYFNFNMIGAYSKMSMRVNNAEHMVIPIMLYTQLYTHISMRGADK